MGHSSSKGRASCCERRSKNRSKSRTRGTKSRNTPQPISRPTSPCRESIHSSTASSCKYINESDTAVHKLPEKQSVVVLPVEVNELKRNQRRWKEKCFHTDQHHRLVISLSEIELDQNVEASFHAKTLNGIYNGNPVRVKKLLRVAPGLSVAQSFIEEIELNKQLRHPKIMQFIGSSGPNSPDIFYVTERLSRGTLCAVIKDTSLEICWRKNAIVMALDIARGMEYLHGRNPPVIHRFLTSSTIHVDEDLTCKVAEFGHFKLLVEEGTMSVSGCPLWTAPEIIRNEKYDEKADVFSFGITLFELDSRKKPYYDEKKRNGRPVSECILMQRVAMNPRFRPKITHNCPIAIAELFSDCVEDNAAQRPSFREISIRLEELLAQTPEQDASFMPNSMVGGKVEF